MSKKDQNGENLSTRRSFLKGAGVAALGVGTLSATGILQAANASTKASGKPIPIGSAVPLTGWAAADGIEYKRGIELAAEEINAMGGILGRPIELFFEDTKEMGPDNVVPAMQRLIDKRNVHAIINGYNSGTGAAEYDMIADDGIIYLHANTNVQHDQVIEKNPGKYDTVFMTDPAEAWYGSGLIKFLNGIMESGEFKPSNKKIALIEGSGNYGIIIGSGIKKAAAEYGWEISMAESVSYGISEWGPTISKIRKDPPGVIAFTHWVPQDLAQFMIQFVPNATDSLIYMQYGPSIAAFRDIAQKSSEGVIFASVAQSLQDEIGLAFMKRYRKKFGEKSSPLNGAIPYDSVFMYAAAAAIAGGTGAPGEMKQNKKVAARFKNMIYRGVKGITNYSEKWQSAVSYPNMTDDPSLGMPHQFAQIQNYKEDASIIAPPPYETKSYQVPPWIKG